MSMSEIAGTQKLLSIWRTQREIAPNFYTWKVIPARKPNTKPYPNFLHDLIVLSLHKKNIHNLFIHQEITLQLCNEGKNVVVVTGTASGKSLCYNLPVLNRMLSDPDMRALFVYPTKALAQDQASELREFIELIDQDILTNKSIDNPETFSQKLAIYDGDTPNHVRASIRNKAQIVISNPDMIHIGILPHHTSWAEFFKHLQFIVLDEIHIYRGVFGSHFANVLRRLTRIAKFYGSYPQFILTSATIANPAELARKLIEESVEIVDQDGSGRGEQTFLIYNPPLINHELGIRRSALNECVRLVDDLITYQLQTVIFGRSRRTVEILLKYLRERIQEISPKKANLINPDKQIRGYRSGYLAQQRRDIEKGLRDGSIRVVVATNALELGINIGKMTASVMLGYPGTISSTRQQAGRAGRGEDPSIALLIATPDPLDQYLASHPLFLFDKSPEHALIDPDNLLILLGHIKCAAFELPFIQGESFGNLKNEKVEEFLELFTQQGMLHKSHEKYFWMVDQYPADKISLRTASSDNILLRVVENGHSSIIGTVDEVSAYWLIHPDAVYLHESQTYLVEKLDLEQKIADLRILEPEYFTEPRREGEVHLIEQYETMEVAGGNKSHGELLVTTQVTGFRKVKWQTNEILGSGDLSLPKTELYTTGYWFTLNDETVEQLRGSTLWTNDQNDYGPDWLTIRNAIRERDGYRCQNCGIVEGERKHEVHHKIPFRSFPTHIQANQRDNLITLCHRCHLQAETQVKIRSGLSGTSYILHRLAPFLLMCDVRDLGVHTDPISPIANGKPTVVIYDQVPAGIGLSQSLYEFHTDLIRRSFEQIESCPCFDGCPSCVGPGGELGSGGKKETQAILYFLTKKP